jgi:hypothetical protein
LKGTALILISAFLATTVGVARGGDDKRAKRDERVLRSLQVRAQRIPKPVAGDDLGEFLMRQTGLLLEQSRSLPQGSYKLHRLMEALDDLLDARDDLEDARRPGSSDDHKREDTARRLERVYFRVQQADYFAKLSGEAHAAEYVLRARQLYQRARQAYDEKAYRQAVKLASASDELVNVLENLAQAAVRRPDPPVLK